MKRPWLVPLIPVYAAGLALRSAGLLLGVQPIRRLRWPVISVGNLSVGGTGKTPFTIALARLLMPEGIHVDVLSRGYGRRSAEVERVDVDGGPERYGDEPLLIARETKAPVYVGPKRWQTGRLAEKEAGAVGGVHLLDDGFQHRQLARTVDIVIVNSEDLGDVLLPAGNLRERVDALRRARVLAVPARARCVTTAQPVSPGLAKWYPAWQPGARLCTRPRRRAPMQPPRRRSLRHP